MPRAQAAASDAATREGTWFHTLEDGIRLEIISAQAREPAGRPPLLFIHGAGHGAWCWQERFMPFFAERGFTCHALSLRGQAGSGVAPGAKCGGSLQEHAADISHFVRSRLQQPPVLIGHSFGGLLVHTYVLQGYAGRAALAGLALLASVPPEGNAEIVARTWAASKLKSFRLTWAFVTKSYLRKASEARFLFFSDDLPDADLERYWGLLREKAAAVPVVDVGRLKSEVRAVPPPAGCPPVCVMGGDADAVVDVAGVEAAAEHYGVRPVLLPGVAHDLMLDTQWLDAAEALESWCRRLQPARA